MQLFHEIIFFVYYHVRVLDFYNNLKHFRNFSCRNITKIIFFTKLRKMNTDYVNKMIALRIW